MVRLHLVFIVLTTLVAFYVATPVQSQGQTVGLFLNEPGSYVGYTLFSAILGEDAYLIDNEGRLVHSWADVGGQTPYLLMDGSILVGPVQGWIRHFAWDGSLLWEYEYSSPSSFVHHDIELLPNGNILLIADEVKTAEEAISSGRDPALLRDDELHSLYLVEIEPVGTSGANIVWEWRSWDHLVQDYDPEAGNYGVVEDSPALIDINFIEFTRPPTGESDWHHPNSVVYNETYDQLMVSIRNFSEIWVIDHSTTTSEAASHSGGNSGKGGDLLYRWGNPGAYGARDAGEQQLFSQHDAQWIQDGLPGEGNILIFNNGNGRGYSSVVEIVPPVDSSGSYPLVPGSAYRPAAPVWEYAEDFFASFLSGAGRLPNGNTLLNKGPSGTFVEVTHSGELVWRYVSPVISSGPVEQGTTVPPQTIVPALHSMVFRIFRYAPDYPGLAGRDLTPMGPIEIVLDSDDDGLFDYEETKIYGTDPLASDTDGDGLSDGDEVLIYGTDPTLVDTDGDSFSDNDEILMRGTDPLRAELLGDVDCDYDVSSIDAALVLQLTAGVVTFLFCQESADVDGDGNTTSIDAAIILQFTARLISSLPP